MGGGATVAAQMKVGERSYEVTTSGEMNVNDTDSYLFALPRTSGRISLRDVNGQLVHDGGVGPGHVRVVAPGERSAMRATERFESVVVAVPAAFCHRVADEVGADVGSGGSIFGSQPVLRPRAPVHRLIPWLRDAARTDDEPARTLVLSGLAIALVGAALGEIGQPGRPAAGQFDSVQKRRVIDYAEGRLETDLNVVEWAATVGLSAAEFGRRFANSFGVPPYTWYLDRRIDNAMTLLREGDTSISETAFRTGFSSQSHFTTVFRRRVGVPPGQWRDGLPRRHG